jgi:hypothetical protein
MTGILAHGPGATSSSRTPATKGAGAEGARNRMFVIAGAGALVVIVIAFMDLRKQR